MRQNLQKARKSPARSCKVLRLLPAAWALFTMVCKSASVRALTRFFPIIGSTQIRQRLSTGSQLPALVVCFRPSRPEACKRPRPGPPSRLCRPLARHQPFGFPSLSGLCARECCCKNTCAGRLLHRHSPPAVSFLPNGCVRPLAHLLHPFSMSMIARQWVAQFCADPLTAEFSALPAACCALRSGFIFYRGLRPFDRPEFVKGHLYLVLLLHIVRIPKNNIA